MNHQKRVAAVHDISGIGKCSLTVALPILSAAGLEAAVNPTAILSTHTGGFTGYTYRDLTEDLLPVAKHWRANDFEFDAFYSGFLGSGEQIDIVCEMIETICTDETVKVVDPAMADNGVLYKIFPESFPLDMKRLAAKADVLTPNITEACLLTGVDYIAGPYSEEFIEMLLKKLCELGAKKIVLTGVYRNEKELGAACYDASSGIVEYVMGSRLDGLYHGTGDIFSSALVCGLMHGKSLPASARVAVDYVCECIKYTNSVENGVKYGVYFEPVLPKLMKLLGIIE